ncbi:Bax inhibitor-1/YccA family protein [Robiginitomaculum antarcticum]|uniref:Bax inhibitor-1/YccA family protein n=1 Tax=Robiginitomaculum antarcticum TaxID=437507 RepID=UPI00037EC67E|nr:Bax inhibitor-1/YccA family protein [Robiginitomaculum antarcticum]
MNQFNNPAAQSASTDAGLRTFLLGTYKYMGMAMLVSMVVAWGFGNYVLIDATSQNGLSAIGNLMYSPMAAIGLTIGIIFAFGAVGRKLTTMSVGSVKVFLFGFAAVMGIWLSSIAVFADPMIAAKVFFMATAAFAGVSLFGYVTKKDLGAVAKVAIMVFIGFIAIMLLGMVFPSMAITQGGGLYLAINVIALIAICVITAWETQQLKRIYYGTVDNPEMAEKMSVYGAASLLLSFINIFSILMNIFSSR